MYVKALYLLSWKIFGKYLQKLLQANQGQFTFSRKIDLLCGTISIIVC